ncbi:MAG: N-acetyl sugar amidotransferase [Alphaproteobacteria bacterium]|nr:N-acetyl sugar amidotransferase [Alphaproteobacteria bacterium]
MTSFRFPQPQPVDAALFQRPADQLDALYGLPRAVKFCRSCVISNQRPNSAAEFKTTKDSLKSTIQFDEHGICDACRAAEIKQKIDWAERERELRDLCDRYRRTDGRWDCIVPGSGGKDSFYAAHVLKYKYGMHPLTVTWAPHIYTEWGWKNFQAWIHAGFDNILSTPNGRAHRLLTRLAVERLFHPFQPFIIGQKSIAPKMSALYDIPLVFYGENEAEYGNPVADNGSAKRDWRYFTAEDKSQIYLSGTSVKELVEEFGFDESDLQPYLPAAPEALQRTQTEVHYLGYYLKWHPQSCYYYSVEHGNFIPSPERTPGTYSKYNSIDDRVDDLHYFTTHVKFGIGRATYDASQEIRSGDITRDEGVALVKRYDGEFPERFIEELLAYLSLPAEQFPVASTRFEQSRMDREYFLALSDRFRSPHLWRQDAGKWSLRKTVWEDRV